MGLSKVIRGDLGQPLHHQFLNVHQLSALRAKKRKVSRNLPHDDASPWIPPPGDESSFMYPIELLCRDKYQILMRSADQKKTLKRVHQVVAISLTNNTLAFLTKSICRLKREQKSGGQSAMKNPARGGVSFSAKPANDQLAREASLAGD